MKPEYQVLNSKGEPIVLNEMEKRMSEYCETVIKNSLGLEVPITTYTGIIKKISEQKFYEISPIDFVPIAAGENQWATNITSFRDFDLAGPFSEGYINTATGNGDVPMASAAVDPVNRRVLNWAKGIQYNVFEMNYAAKFGNWDIVEKKERARKRNWDLGFQSVCFKGSDGFNGASGSVLGLLNQPGANVNTTTITKAIKDMNVADWTTFVSAVLDAYRVNCNYTAWPTHFAIPESDFLGLARPLNPSFPLAGSDVFSLVQNIFRTLTGNQQFKVLPLRYADATLREDMPSDSVNYGKQVYALYNYDMDSMRIDCPVPYTATVQNTINGFTWQNVGYATHTGLVLTRPAELLYFTYAA